MVYLWLLLALILLAVKGYCGKCVSMVALGTSDNFLFNLIRMLLCVFIGLIIVLVGGGGGTLLPCGGMLLICLLAGVANVAFLVGWMLAVQHNAMVTVDVTLTIGSLIPALLCAVLFGEPLLPQKMLGFALIVLASAVLAGYNKSKGKSNAAGLIFLTLAVIGDGMVSFSQQLYIKFYMAGGAFAGERVYPMSLYHFYTYVFAALTLCLMLGILLLYRGASRRRAYVREVRPRLVKALPHVGVMALCLFAATYLQTVATGDYAMPSQMLYPIIKGGCLITVNITAMLFFGERITLRSVCGSLLALAGIVIMSVL